MVAGLCHFVFSTRKDNKTPCEKTKKKTPRKKTKRRNNAMRKDETQPRKKTKFQHEIPSFGKVFSVQGSKQEITKTCPVSKRKIRKKS